MLLQYEQDETGTSSAVTPAGSVHKSRDDNMVNIWVLLKR